MGQSTVTKRQDQRKTIHANTFQFFSMNSVELKVAFSCFDSLVWVCFMFRGRVLLLVLLLLSFGFFLFVFDQPKRIASTSLKPYIQLIKINVKNYISSTKRSKVFFIVINILIFLYTSQ